MISEEPEIVDALALAARIMACPPRYLAALPLETVGDALAALKGAAGRLRAEKACIDSMIEELEKASANLLVAWKNPY